MRIKRRNVNPLRKRVRIVKDGDYFTVQTRPFWRPWYAKQKVGGYYKLARLEVAMDGAGKLIKVKPRKAIVEQVQ